ncbi:MAG: PspC domain-containing protein [Phycicoccus sp.]|nr:PspC domain-containing protein [Phycicoccus sp.]
MTDPFGTAAPPPTAAPGPPPPSGSGLDWDALRRVGVTRDLSNGWVSGTSAGVAARFDVDPLLIRAGFVALAFTGGIGIPLYLASWLLLPDTSGRILLREAASGAGAPIVLAIAFALSLIVPLGLSNQDGGLSFPPGMLALGIAAVVIYRARRRRSTHPTGMVPPQPPPPPVTWTPAAPRVTDTRWSPSGSLPSPSQTATVAVPTYAADHDASPAASSSPTPSSPSLYRGPVADAVTWAPAPAQTYPHQGLAPQRAMASRTATYPTTPRPPAPSVAGAGPVRSGRRRPRRAPRGTSLMVLAVVIGAFWAAVVAAPGWGYPQTPWAIGIVAAFAVAAACTFVLGMLGRRGGLATLLTLVLLISAPVAGVVAASGQSPADLVAHTWTPTRAGESRSLAVADANLDLSALTLADADGSPVRLSLLAGTATVLVPDDLPVTLTMSLGAGDIDLGQFAPAGQAQQTTDGVGVERTLTIEPMESTTTGVPVEVVIEVGVGNIVLEPIPATSRSLP